MKAMVVTTYGGPEVLRSAELPVPTPGPSELRIRVTRTLATLADCAFRSAQPFVVRLFAGLLRPRDPVLGDTFAGTVDAVGAEVTGFRPGDRVFGSIAPRAGTYAEYFVMPSSGPIQRIPDHLTDTDAVALADGYMTAITFVRDAARARSGMHMLVLGASGAIGSAGVQLAKHYGAEVTGVCSTKNVALVASLGADRVIDYTEDDFTARRGTYDVVFDAVGKSSFRRCEGALKPGGGYLTTVPSLGIAGRMLWQAMGGRGRQGKTAKLLTTGLRPVAIKTRDMALLVELIAAGALRPIVDRTYPLEEAARAHRFVEAGRKVGSVVLSVG